MNSAYEYRNLPLKPRMIQELIRELFAGRGSTKKEDIVNVVTQTHENRGGLPSESDNVNQIFGVQLKAFEGKGLQNGLSTPIGRYINVSPV